MGQIYPFIARIQASGDWTAAERARLDAMAEGLTAAGGGRVEVIYGTTEAGDPWCVVKDHNEEVLVHVARIGGKFVVHSFVDDVLSEDYDLHAALRDRLREDAAPEPDEGVVVPFTGRHAQSVIALVVAAAFFYETAVAPAEAEASVTPVRPAPEPEAPPADLSDGPREQEAVVQASIVVEALTPQRAAVLAVAAAEPQATALSTDLAVAEPVLPEVAELVADPDVEAPEIPPFTPAPTVIVGTDGDDLLVGTPEAEWLIGGAGDDTLDGGGGRDTLDGGSGDDLINLTSEAVARGGEGADTFVVQAPQIMGDEDVLLGTVRDLNLAEGDIVVADTGQTANLVTPPPPPPGGPGFTAMAPSLVAPVDHRALVDIDGDGVADGHLWLRAPALPAAGSGGGKTGYASAPGGVEVAWSLRTEAGVMVLELYDDTGAAGLRDELAVGRLLDAAEVFG